MKPGDLTDKQQLALHWLAEHTDVWPEFGKSNNWTRPARRAQSFEFAVRAHKAGLHPTGKTRDHWNVGGAANTLVALKRRGLASNDGGGAWLQAEWWITPVGAQLLGDAAEDDQ